MTDPVLDYQLTVWRDAIMHAEVRARECEDMYTEKQIAAERAKVRVDQAHEELRMLRAVLAECKSRQVVMEWAKDSMTEDFPRR